MPATTKSIELIEDPAARLIEVHLTGKLEKADYEAFVPEIERVMSSCDAVRMLIILDDFHGWTIGALWEDLKFDIRHFRDIDRLAIVGESRWESGMAAFCRPFTTAEIEYFNIDRLAEAREWIEGISA